MIFINPLGFVCAVTRYWQSHTRLCALNVPAAKTTDIRKKGVVKQPCEKTAKEKRYIMIDVKLMEYAHGAAEKLKKINLYIVDIAVLKWKNIEGKTGKPLFVLKELHMKSVIYAGKILF